MRWRGGRADLEAVVTHARQRVGLPAADGAQRGWVFASDGRVRRPGRVECRQLSDERIPPVDGLKLPTHCFPDHIVYGVVVDGRVVSVAYAHTTGILEDRLADIGVETAQRYRRRGFASAVVAAVASHASQAGGQAVYMCDLTNEASIATARRAGFELYARRIVGPAPAPDLPR